ncbi:hypothetical protein D3C81_1862650 [compost metagenome]
MFEQLDQVLAFAVGQVRVEHQLAGGVGVVADQGPGIQAKVCVRQAEVVDGVPRQVFQAASEIVAEVADQAAGEGQLQAGR